MIRNTTKTPVSTACRILAGLLLTTGLGHGLSANVFLIDFGSEASEANITSLTGWNNVVPTTPVDVPMELVDSTGANSGTFLTITTAFSSSNASGQSDGLGDFPGSATKDTLLAHVGDQPTVVFSGLDLNSVYTFEIYASRAGVTDDRGGIYTVTGATSSSGELNASGNLDILSLASVAPTPAGEITFDFVVREGNVVDYAYLGVMRIESVAVPEPGSLALGLGLLSIAGVAIHRSRRINSRNS